MVLSLARIQEPPILVADQPERYKSEYGAEGQPDCEPPCTLCSWQAMLWLLVLVGTDRFRCRRARYSDNGRIRFWDS